MTYKKNIQHQVEVGELQKFIIDEEVTFASSTRERKKILCSLNGGIKVIVGGEIIWQGIQPFAAVEAYNSITAKYVDKLKDFRI